MIGVSASIDLGIFKKEEMREISVVIFSNTLTLGKLSTLGKSIHPDPANIINVRYDHTPPHYKIQEVSQTNPEHLLEVQYILS